jgi:cysteine synthase
MIRKRVSDLVTRPPRFIELEPPLYVRQADWFLDSHLEGRTRTLIFAGWERDVYSGKLGPVDAMFRWHEERGDFLSEPYVVIGTSGNAGKDAALVAQGYSVRGVIAIVNHGTLRGKLRHLEASGAMYVEAPEGVQSTDYMYEYAEKHGHVLMNQYTNRAAIEGHRLTMKHFFAEGVLRGTTKFDIGGVTGTCSVVMAAHQLKEENVHCDARVFGVASKEGEKIPGSRTLKDLKQLERLPGHFPYKTALDFDLVTNISMDRVYSLNAERVQGEANVSMGPTCALLEAGRYELIERAVDGGTLEEFMRGGEINLALLFGMDSYLAYLDDDRYMSYFSSMR